MKNMQKVQALGGPLAVRKKSDDGGSIKLSKGVEGHGSTLCLRSVAAVSNPMPVASVYVCVCVNANACSCMHSYAGGFRGCSGVLHL